MIGPASTPIGADEVPRGKEFHKSGPWLIVYGHGPESEARARRIAEQCDARGVDYELTTTDETDTSTLRYYVALVVVLPSAAVGERARSLTELIELIRAYRARRTDGLDTLVGGRRRWFEIGVVQVFDDATGGIRSILEPIMEMICRHHQLGQHEAPMAFACYDNLSQPGHQEANDGDSDHLARTIERLRATLGLWGIDWSIGEVTAIRKVIDGMREQWENPAFTDLHRPIPHCQRNRLDFILDEPAFLPLETDCTRKKWMEGGQRVVTRVVDELQQTFPHVHRPHGRDGKKGKQKDFQDLYQTLRAAEKVLAIRYPGVS